MAFEFKTGNFFYGFWVGAANDSRPLKGERCDLMAGLFTEGLTGSFILLIRIREYHSAHGPEHPDARSDPREWQTLRLSEDTTLQEAIGHGHLCVTTFAMDQHQKAFPTPVHRAIRRGDLAAAMELFDFAGFVKDCPVIEYTELQAVEGADAARLIFYDKQHMIAVDVKRAQEAGVTDMQAANAKFKTWLEGGPQP